MSDLATSTSTHNDSKPIIYYLRVEAVNLSAFVFDTQDLSTIRGGGLLLLHLVDQRLKDKLKYLAPITTGASAGLFRFEDRDPAEVQIQVEQLIRTDNALKHATFVVDVRPASSSDGPDDRAHGGNSSFIPDREMLIAQNRWRQMRQPSLAVPSWNKDSLPVCRKDRVRPAPETMSDPEDRSKVLPVSASVHQRRQFGLDQKRALYKRLTAIDGLPGIDQEYTLEFDTLVAVERDEPDRHGIPTNLVDKMAVIHIDGNSFGKIQDETATNATDQTLFDTRLKERRNHVLRSLLETIGADESWKTKAGRYRLETLLWGGDEIVWVVPAWKGWEMLRRFFELTKGWETDWTDSPQALTHCAGLVFCHYKAPIHRIKALAEDLVKAAKRKSRKENLFAYAVLETFDHINDGVEGYWDARLPKHVISGDVARREEAREGWVLAGESMNAVVGVVRAFKAHHFPRRKLYQIVRERLDEREPERYRETIKSTWRELGLDAEEPIEGETAPKPKVDLAEGPLGKGISLETLPAWFHWTFGPTSSRWGHLAELWDYLA